MTEKSNYYISPALQLLYLILIVFGCMIIGTVLSFGIIASLYGTDVLREFTNITSAISPDAVPAFKILIALGNTVFIFFVPAIFFSYLIVKEPEAYLKTTTRFPWILLVLTLIIMLASSPIMEFMINLNQKMVLPDFLSSVEKWMRASEETAQKTVEIILKMKTPADLISSIFIVALLPALSEEFLFRGCIQTIFTRWTKNVHVAIWITAILFSTFHMEFFGFLPRTMLGVLFGYLVAWSGSIWTAVWAHFINNGTAVIASYLFQHKKISVNPNDQHIFNYASYLFSLIIVLFLLWLYRKIAQGRNQVQNI